MKYKEFYVYTKGLDDAFLGCDLGDAAPVNVVLYPHKDSLQYLTHVIEYQVYEKLQKQILERDNFIEVRGKHVIELADKINKLQKQNEKLKDIATRVSKQGCNPVNQYDCLACDATKILKEIEQED